MAELLEVALELGGGPALAGAIGKPAASLLAAKAEEATPPRTGGIMVRQANPTR